MGEIKRNARKKHRECHEEINAQGNAWCNGQELTTNAWTEKVGGTQWGNARGCVLRKARGNVRDTKMMTGNAEENTRKRMVQRRSKNPLGSHQATHAEEHKVYRVLVFFNSESF